MTTTPNRQQRQQRALAYLVSLAALVLAFAFLLVAVRDGDPALAVVALVIGVAGGSNAAVRR